MKKTLRVIFNIVTYLIIILGVFFVIFTFSNKKSGGEIAVFGHKMMFVKTESMEGEKQAFDIQTIKAGSLIFVKANEDNDLFLSELKTGDVITFKMPYGEMMGETITHRVSEIQKYPIKTETGDEVFAYRVVTHGDRNDITVVEVLNSSTTVFIGKVSSSSYVLGRIYTLITAKYSILFLVIIPSVILLVMEIMKIASIIAKEKARKVSDKTLSDNEKEIAALKEKLSQLSSTSTQSQITTSPQDTATIAQSVVSDDDIILLQENTSSQNSDTKTDCD